MRRPRPNRPRTTTAGTHTGSPIAATPAAPDSYPTVPAAVPAQQSTPPAGAVPRAASVDASSYPATPPYLPVVELPHHDNLSSAYIPVDSFVYPEALRLYSLGYLDTAFINMRPWTRRSLLHMLQLSTPAIMSDGNGQAIEILAKLNEYLAAEDPTAPMQGLHFHPRGQIYGVQSVYTRLMGIDGQILRDSFHLGQTIANDYGRPYESGFNNVTGFSTLNEYGRFSLFVRGEYQRAPSGYGYSNTDTSNPLTTVTDDTGTNVYTLASYLSDYLDAIPYVAPLLNQATIPNPHIATQNNFRIQEATLSVHFLGHEISGGKSDAWLGPSAGSAMAWSNNAEDIYSFRINRVEPMYIPFVDKVLGPLRYDFFVGSLKGHVYPNAPWVHSEMFSFAPSSNFQFAFQRTVIWGGATGHVPITFGTVLPQLLLHQRHRERPCLQELPQRPRRALQRLQLLLPPALRAQAPHPYARLHLPRRRNAHQRAAPCRLPSRTLSLAGSRHPQARLPRRGRQHRHLHPAQPQGPVQLHRNRSAPGLHQQGLHHGRLDRPRSQGRRGVAHLSSLRQ